jgi:hypothetical protein
MPNYCSNNVRDIAHRARSNMHSMQHRCTLATAFWKQAELF